MPTLGPVLYWQERQELCVVKDSPWHATSWRNIPDYQGGKYPYQLCRLRLTMQASFLTEVCT